MLKPHIIKKYPYNKQKNKLHTVMQASRWVEMNELTAYHAVIRIDSKPLYVRRLAAIWT